MPCLDPQDRRRGGIGSLSDPIEPASVSPQPLVPEVIGLGTAFPPPSPTLPHVVVWTYMHGHT